MFSLKPYGIVIALAMLAGYLVGFWRRKKYQLEASDLENLFLLTVPLGIIGARLYHVLDKWEYYSQHLSQIPAVWNGGLGVYGAVGGGIVGLIVYKKISNFNPPAGGQISNLLDFLMPSLAIGQAIGRWGNFFNHEAFGGPTNLPWKWFIPPNFRPEYWKNYSYFHPTFGYESLWVLVGFTLLIFIEKHLATREPNTGLLTGFYAFWYGLGRFFFEFLRFDTAEVGGIKVAQIISLLLIAVGLWLVRKRVSPTGKSLM
ncbi:prolipoprotein diacylglyceryl transferase [Candidatus Gottesmanbacteria bacterium]|nr:prolipoprotein diacylglyceryl transferase [Candidatus Gottesmanbacteria bacterium]